MLGIRTSASQIQTRTLIGVYGCMYHVVVKYTSSYVQRFMSTNSSAMHLIVFNKMDVKTDMTTFERLTATPGLFIPKMRGSTQRRIL